MSTFKIEQIKKPPYERAEIVKAKRQLASMLLSVEADNMTETEVNMLYLIMR